jgi:hypothetical protein
MTRKLLMTVVIMLSRSPPPSALVLPRPSDLAEVLVVAVSTAAGLAATVSMAEVLTAAVLPVRFFQQGFFRRVWWLLSRLLWIYGYGYAPYCYYTVYGTTACY